MKNNKTGEFKRRLYVFILRLIKFVERLKKTQTSKVVGDQLLRSGTSILGNYIEGQSASSKKDYTNYFTHSLIFASSILTLKGKRKNI